MVDLAKLEDLKQLMVSAEDFSEPWSFFFDHFGESPQFMTLGKIVKSPLLTALMKRLAREVSGNQAQVTLKVFKLLEKERFVHGSAFFGGQMAVVFFFQDIEMGMVSFTTSGLETQLVRFTSSQIRNNELTLPPTISKELH